MNDQSEALWCKCLTYSLWEVDRVALKLRRNKGFDEATADVPKAAVSKLIQEQRAEKNKIK